MLLGYTPGVWDLLHVGHLRFLRTARELCDRLIVGVPSDIVVQQDKGRLPTISLDHRCEMLDSLWFINQAIPYYRLEFITHLELLKPDVIFIGETWGEEERHHDAMDWCRDNDCRVIQLPYYRGESTTSIKERICNERKSSTG